MFGTRVPWNRGNGTWRLRARSLTHAPLSLINLSLYEINERTVHLQKRHLEIPRIGGILPFSLTLLNVLSVEYRRTVSSMRAIPHQSTKKLWDACDVSCRTPLLIADTPPPVLPRPPLASRKSTAIS